MKKSILGSAGLISACILLSRILGFLRDVLCTGFFGPVWDAFIFAFQIPNLFRRLFGEGALSAAFIPTLSSYINQKPFSEVVRLINVIITMLFGFLALIAGLVILTTFVIPFITPSLVQPTKVFSPVFLKLLRIMIPYMPLICLVALLQAVLNSFKHFLMPALASVVLNICWIGGFIIAGQINTSDENKVAIIAWAILAGGILEVLIQLPPLFKRNIIYRPAVDFRHPGLKEILRLMGPVVIGLAVFQVNLFIDNLIAYALIPEKGAVSALYYGNRLMQFPFALIGISLATAVFPFLAEYVARNDISGMFKELNKALRIALFVGFPASVGLMVLAEPVIHWSFYSLPSALFHIKSFSLDAVSRTTFVLIFYSIGIWSYGAVQITNRAFYSLKDMVTPVKVGIYMVITNFILNIILVFPFRESGIALATTVSSILNLVILLYILGRKSRTIAPEAGGILSAFMKSLILPLFCSLLMGMVCYLGFRYLPPAPNLLWETVRVLGLVVLGIGSYLGFSKIFQPHLMTEVIHPKKTS
ncbi:MAG: murein biosynthesis integral membrane protein MurJ [Planctomycetes bacterium]|nr:murein biosynthesis integral membrane protein MurJ [Planctomycetota bacterium]